MFSFEVFFFLFFIHPSFTPAGSRRCHPSGGNGEEREVILNCFEPGVSQVKMFLPQHRFPPLLSFDCVVIRILDV